MFLNWVLMYSTRLRTATPGPESTECSMPAGFCDTARLPISVASVSLYSLRPNVQHSPIPHNEYHMQERPCIGGQIRYWQLGGGCLISGERGENALYSTIGANEATTVHMSNGPNSYITSSTNSSYQVAYIRGSGLETPNRKLQEYSGHNKYEDPGWYFLALFLLFFDVPCLGFPLKSL